MTIKDYTPALSLLIIAVFIIGSIWSYRANKRMYNEYMKQIEARDRIIEKYESICEQYSEMISRSNRDKN